jgi:hypothetical protein
VLRARQPGNRLLSMLIVMLLLLLHVALATLLNPKSKLTSS